MLLTSHYGGVFGLTSLSNIVEKFDANKYDWAFDGIGISYSWYPFTNRPMIWKSNSLT